VLFVKPPWVLVESVPLYDNVLPSATPVISEGATPPAKYLIIVFTVTPAPPVALVHVNTTCWLPLEQVRLVGFNGLVSVLFSLPQSQSVQLLEGVSFPIIASG